MHVIFFKINSKLSLPSTNEQYQGGGGVDSNLKWEDIYRYSNTNQDNTLSEVLRAKIINFFFRLAKKILINASHA
jgi:hypothetical protein